MPNSERLTPESALQNLLDSLLESGDWINLEAGCEGGGPVIRAYAALRLPLPAPIQDALREDGLEYVIEEHAKEIAK